MPPQSVAIKQLIYWQASRHISTFLCNCWLERMFLLINRRIFFSRIIKTLKNRNVTLFLIIYDRLECLFYFFIVNFLLNVLLFSIYFFNMLFLMLQKLVKVSLLTVIRINFWFECAFLEQLVSLFLLDLINSLIFVLFVFFYLLSDQPLLFFILLNFCLLLFFLLLHKHLKVTKKLFRCPSFGIQIGVLIFLISLAGSCDST